MPCWVMPSSLSLVLEARLMRSQYSLVVGNGRNAPVSPGGSESLCAQIAQPQQN